MKYSVLSIAAVLAALAAPVVSLAVPVDDEPRIEVILTRVGNTEVMAEVRNPTSHTISLVKNNFFGDDGPVQKARVFRADGTELEFGGIKRHFNPADIKRSGLMDLLPGGFFQDLIQLGTSVAGMATGGGSGGSSGGSGLSDLLGGIFKVRSEGSVLYSRDGGPIEGSLEFRSNELELKVDPVESANVKRTAAGPVKRTKLECTGDDVNALTAALNGAKDLATKAAEAAKAGGPRVEEYFKTTDAATIEKIVANFQAIANEANVDGTNNTIYQCQDTLGECEDNSVSYVKATQNTVVNCPRFYPLPDLTTECFAMDKATTVINQLSHFKDIMNPPTTNLGLGYEAAVALTPEQVLVNSDTYALFANAVALDCKKPEPAQEGTGTDGTGTDGTGTGGN